jgi:hypothetical protein
MIMMEDKDLSGRMDVMEQKIDRILEHLTRQDLQREVCPGPDNGSFPDR